MGFIKDDQQSSLFFLRLVLDFKLECLAVLRVNRCVGASSSDEPSPFWVPQLRVLLNPFTARDLCFILPSDESENDWLPHWIVAVVPVHVLSFWSASSLKLCTDPSEVMDISDKFALSLCASASMCCAMSVEEDFVQASSLVDNHPLKLLMSEKHCCTTSEVHFSWVFKAFGLNLRGPHFRRFFPLPIVRWRFLAELYQISATKEIYVGITVLVCIDIVSSKKLESSHEPSTKIC